MSSSPATFSSRPITGMAAGEVALAIDFRAAAPLSRLYAITNFGQLYLISNPSTGAAVAVGPGGIAINGTEVGLDFNPTVDRIRLITDNEQNLRLHPDLGTVVATDLSLAFAGSDVNAGSNPQATGAAYTNSFAGATTTTLYDVDASLDVLVTQLPPNNGTLNTVGSLGANVDTLNGFDISGATTTAYAAFHVPVT
ncbi:MAG: DUF4394 domain-containing protein [Candidatus Eisenbacteria bacterium]|uniref:DUF4394 domain-containing protein n=1 Tax=Eiseniibacteriota bacterium TaxID=2212470 RepID=A0A849SFI5_UNCEI|nr:DUF4394 domain-containing protein [Candidatus Eisenbacteria bacterium]